MAQKLIFIVLTIFIITGSALKCPTCSKESCKKVNIPQVECDETSKELKYGYLRNSEVSTLACVSLEYEIEKKIVPVRQCLAVSPTDNVCKDISLSLPRSIKLTNCEFELNEKLELDVIDDLRETTTESTKTTTPGVGSISTFSFTILGASFILIQLLY